MMFKQNITAVYVFKNGMIAVFDQFGTQIPFFQGRQSEAMPKIKRRIARQMPCNVRWEIQEGAKFSVKNISLFSKATT
jgi:hypothetical protein